MNQTIHDTDRLGKPNKPVKCYKKDPSTCRIHGKTVKAQQQMVEAYLRRKRREEAELKKARELGFKIENDLNNNLKLKTHPDGSTTCSVYRSGVVEPPKERGVEKNVYAESDQYAPTGRQTRTTAVFASPTIGGVNRWVKGNALGKNSNDISVKELTVNIDTTYVYSIPVWEQVSTRADFTDNKEKLYSQYWETGITMREWLTKVKENPVQYSPAEWELLLPMEEIVNVKPVSAKRVVAYNYNGEYDKTEIYKLLKQSK